MRVCSARKVLEPEPHLLINSDTPSGEKRYTTGFCACNEILKRNPGDTKYHNSTCGERSGSARRRDLATDGIVGEGLVFYHFFNIAAVSTY